MKLLLVDDHPLFCVGFAHALAHVLPGALLLTAPSLNAGLQAAAGEQDLDLVLLDQRLGADTGIRGLRLFAEQYPLVARVVISGDEDPALATAARAAGASGFLGKSRSVPALATALQCIAQGGVVFDGLSAVHASATQEASPCPPTARQREVLTLLALGHPNKRIAQELRIAERTVKLHVTALLVNLQARNRTHMVARQQGLLPQ